MRRRAGWRVLAGVGLLMISCSGHGEGRLPDSVQIHGFAAQSYVQTSDNNFLGDTDGSGSFEFREIGLNGSWTPNPNLQLSLQLLSRSAGSGDNGNIRLDYGLLDYSFVSNEQDRWGVRIGRVKTPFGFYNETRDVPFTRPSIFLPQSIYFDRTRDLALSSDGALFYGEHRTDKGDFFLQAGAGLPRTDNDELKTAVAGPRAQNDLDPELSWVARGLYERNGGQLRLGLTAAELRVKYDYGPYKQIPDSSLVFRPWILSAQYNTQRWSLTGEFALRPSSFSDNDKDDPVGQSWYVQGQYRFAPRWEALLRYDVYYADRSDKDGEKWASESKLGMPAHSRYAKDITVGLTWDATDWLMLRAEYHNVDGTGWLAVGDNPPLGGTTRRWDMFAVQASVRF